MRFSLIIKDFQRIPTILEGLYSYIVHKVFALFNFLTITPLVHACLPNPTKQCPIQSKYLIIVLIVSIALIARRIHTSITQCVNRRWREERGLPAKRTQYGPLTTRPDFTFLDGRPTPIGVC